MHKVTVKQNLTPVKTVKDLIVGQFAVITDIVNFLYTGEVVVKVYNNVVVSLSNPKHTWSNGNGDILQVNILKPGTILNIEINDTDYD